MRILSEYIKPNNIGLRYSEDVVKEAIEKIHDQVPGLIHSENEYISNDICQWLRDRL